MCTNFVLIKKKSVERLANKLSVDPGQLTYLEHAKPGASISIIKDSSDGHMIRSATWWLFLKQTPTGLKPHPDYFSVNTRYDKLPKRPEFKTSRCIVPATAFMESQNGKNPHLLEPDDDSAIVFGGLYKEWVDKATGELVTSASIITLPGHPALENIHRKSTPLWLDAKDYDRWLDHTIKDTHCLADLLTPQLVSDIRATPIDKMGKRNPVGDSFIVKR